MIKPTNLFIVSGAVIGAYFVHHAYAVGTAPAAFSQYGQIQAVQNYSSNPFWHPGSPYNQKAIPKPIYVTGADLNTGDCNRIVENLVASFCASNNNCVGMRLADVRPTIMVQLSQLPGHNFATSCGGYIDSMFNKYDKSGTALNLPLPTGTTTGTATFQFKNPYEIKPTAEQQAVADRATELAALQAQTGGVTGVSAAAFPKTLADLSFTDRMANAATGYEPYKDKSAYKIPEFEDDNSEAFLKRLQKNNPTEYCKRFPTASIGGKECKCVLDPDDPECKICSDPTHMDETCECLNKPQTTKNANGLCVCVNGGDINNDCAIAPNPTPTPTPNPTPTPHNSQIPECIVKLGNDSEFKNNINALIPNKQTITEAIATNKTSVYLALAQGIADFCITNSTDLELNEFNNYLDSELPLIVHINSENISVNAEELFNYISYYTFPIIVTKPPIYELQQTLSKKDVSLTPKEKCVPHHLKYFYILDTPGIKAAAEAVYGNDSLYRIAPTTGYYNIFPGSLVRGHTLSTSAEVVQHPNYVISRRKVKQFVSKLMVQPGSCSGLSAVVYLAAIKNATKNTIMIKSEPFLIP